VTFVCASDGGEGEFLGTVHKILRIFPQSESKAGTCPTGSGLFLQKFKRMTDSVSFTKAEPTQSQFQSFLLSPSRKGQGCPVHGKPGLSSSRFSGYFFYAHLSSMRVNRFSSDGIFSSNLRSTNGFLYSYSSC
jgi:hypothetical protein